MSAPRPPLLAIGLLSATALGYEILLMRLLSIIQWHHFAYMIISLALLGYGFSGTLITLLQSRLQRHFNGVFVGAFVLFSLSSVGCFAVAQQLPFHPEALLWDGRQAGYLLVMFAVLSLPFFFAASAFCLAFMHYAQDIARIYAFDLVGAGLGSVLIVGLLFALMPLDALNVLALAALVGAIVAAWSLPLSRRTVPTLIIVLLGLGLTLAQQAMQLEPSQFKPLSQTLQIHGTEVIDRHSSPLGLVEVVESRQVPFRHAPGLSLNATTEPPPQLGVFVDGGGMSAITRWQGERSELDYLDQQSSALAYHLRPAQRVLVLGAGPGSDVLQAWYHGVGHIDAVELNPQMIDLVTNRFGPFAGHLYDQAFVQVHIEDVRRFLARPRGDYDVIQLALIDGFNASAAGLYALNESYLYTREALREYVQHLDPGGYVSITRWIKMPPRDTLKLFATAVDALRAMGVARPRQHLLLIRSWQTSTLLIKRSPLGKAEIEAARAFARSRSFDIAYYPGIRRAEVNRFNILKEPHFYRAAQAIVSERRERFFQDYKFNLQPATDDRPFFHQFFKWSTLEEILSLRGQGGMALLEWGYLVLIFTLLVALILSLVLILSPLALLRRQRQHSAIGKMRVLGYFFFIGLAFLFVEIAFIQKFMLLLHHPTYAVAVILTAFLVFSGLGAQASTYLVARLGAAGALALAVALIALFSLTILIASARLFPALLQLAIGWKMAITLLSIAPLAFAMGMPFPIALSQVARYAPAYVPWAWAINGFASVISAVLATLLAIHWGFSAVVLLALVLYISLLLLLPRPVREAASGAAAA